MIGAAFLLVILAVAVWVLLRDAPANRASISEFRARENTRPKGNAERWWGE